MKLHDVLDELRQYYHHDKDAIIKECIQKRLNDSATAYYDELQFLSKHILNSNRSIDTWKELKR